MPILRVTCRSICISMHACSTSGPTCCDVDIKGSKVFCNRAPDRHNLPQLRVAEASQVSVTIKPRRFDVLVPFCAGRALTNKVQIGDLLCIPAAAGSRQGRGSS